MRFGEFSSSDSSDFILSRFSSESAVNPFASLPPVRVE